MSFAKNSFPSFELAHDSPQDPVGDRIPLWISGATLGIPKQEVIKELAQADSRVHYFATPNLKRAHIADRGTVYSSEIARHLGHQVAKDFPNTRIAVRGTAVALTQKVPCGENRQGKVYMSTAWDVLQNGNEFGADRVWVSEIEPDGELTSEAAYWLGYICNDLVRELEREQADQVFPALLVYETDAFKNKDFKPGFNELTGSPASRLAALYITDKIY